MCSVRTIIAATVPLLVWLPGPAVHAQSSPELVQPGAFSEHRVEASNASSKTLAESLAPLPDTRTEPSAVSAEPRTETPIASSTHRVDPLDAATEHHAESSAASSAPPAEHPSAASPLPPAGASDGIGIALSATALDDLRGGSDLVFNDMQLKGTVANTRASQVITGSNAISEGSFANASGLPTVIQNSGANVLIQNATILNVQFRQ